MKMSAILIAAVALGATAPALATHPGPADQPKVTYDAKRDKYCVSQMITGSYLPVRDCRTKEDWAKAGVAMSQPDDTKTLASK